MRVKPPVTESCTLPTAEQPARLAEFGALCAVAARSVHRPGPGRLRLELIPTAAVAARTADLVVRETGCCSFFTFTLMATAGELALEVAVPAAHVAVLDALAGVAAEGGPR